MTTQAVAPAPAARIPARPHAVSPVEPIRRAAAPRPNDPCPCGSGKKNKKCCGPEVAALKAPAVPALQTFVTQILESMVCPDDTHSARQSEDFPETQPVESAQTNHLSENREGNSSNAAPATPTVQKNDEPAPEPSRITPLAEPGTGCAAWMRLTGLYPWAPMSLTERRAALSRLVRHTRHWLRQRKVSGSQPNPSMEVGDHDGELTFKTDHELTNASGIPEPSRELAEELEISEAKLNQFCREATGHSAREMWDTLRAPDALRAIRAEIEAALDGALLDRTARIRRHGVKLEDLHRALRQARRLEGSTAAGRAWALGFRSAARLNWALWQSTGKTMQQHEAAILKELYATWHFDHQTCRICAKNADINLNHRGHRDRGELPYMLTDEPREPRSTEFKPQKQEEIMAQAV